MFILGQLALLALAYSQDTQVEDGPVKSNILYPNGLWKWQVTPESNFQNCLDACEHPPPSLGKEKCINGCVKKLCVENKDKPKPMNCPENILLPPWERDSISIPLQKKWFDRRNYFVPDLDKELSNCLTKACKAPEPTCTVEQCQAGCYGTYCFKDARPAACPDASLLWYLSSTFQKYPCDWPKTSLIENADLWL